ncbi:MAG: GGDEF domain-containing response regulator [Roseibium sp.]
MAVVMFETGPEDGAVPHDLAVHVGYYSPDGLTPPVLPGGFLLRPVEPDPLLNACPVPVCLVEEAASNSLCPDLLGGAGRNCQLIVLLNGAPESERQLKLLAAGADDVVFGRDPAQLAVALKRAAGIARKLDRLQRECREISIERDNLQAAIDNLPSPIFFKNRAGIYSGCNRAFEGFIGLPAAKVRGSSVYDVAPEELAKVYEAADEALMREGGVQIYEAEVRYATGEYRTVTFHKAVTRDKASGEVNGLAGAMLDITERKKLEEQLKRAAERDDLTDAYNRRRFLELAEEARNRSKARATPLSVLVIDVDHFKLINDRHGHASGDAALRHLVAVFDSVLADSHVFARAGGEEFFCLLEGCEAETAREIAETIRVTVESTSFFRESQLIPLRVSIGAATASRDETIDQVIGRADEALYRAKETGRNRVCSA